MKRILSIISTLGLLVSCNSDYIVQTPDFTVSGPLVVKAGEAAVFNITGNPDIITFYSGEPGNAYEYMDHDRIGEVDVQMSFMTTTASGTAGNPNPARLPLYYSTDFSGNYTPADVTSATWTEITDRFSMPDDVGISNMASGSPSIDDIFPNDGRPVYLMYSYLLNKYDEALANGRTQWSIIDFKIDGIYGYDKQTLYDINECNWQFVMGPGTENYSGAMPDLPGSSARILFRFDFRPANDMQLWAVSGPILKPENINLGPDRGVGIKATSDPAMNTYRYIYSTPGEYTVTFVGANVNMNGREENVQHIQIKVIEAESETADALEITASTLECNVGEYINFTFAGDVNTLDFWSGEDGHNYEFANGGKAEDAQMYMQFRTCMLSGNQLDNLRIKYSTDFNGNMTENAILAATWTDITDRFTLPEIIAESGNPNSSATNFTKYVKSGNRLVSDCYINSENVYFAMFWEIQAYDTALDNGRTVTWVTGWEVTGTYTDGTSEKLFDMETATTEAVQIVEGASYGSDTNHCGWYTNSGFTADLNNHFRFFSAFRPAEVRKAYALTKQPVTRGKKMTGADTPHTIKTDKQNSLPSTWAYTYSEPGEYDVVFVIGTTGENGEPVTQTKEFTITVK